MSKRRMRDDEIETLIEFVGDYVVAIIEDRNSDSVEAAMDSIRKRETLKEYLTELVNEHQ